jgi:hypothetical protein
MIHLAIMPSILEVVERTWRAKIEFDSRSDMAARQQQKRGMKENG